MESKIGKPCKAKHVKRLSHKKKNMLGKKYFLIPLIILMLLSTPALAKRDKEWRIGYRFPGDINHDCMVNYDDFIILAGFYGIERGDELYRGWIDTNKDGIIDMWDVDWIELNYGSCC